MSSEHFMEGYEQGMADAMNIMQKNPEAYGSMFAASTWRIAAEQKPTLTGYYLVQVENRGTCTIQVAMFAVNHGRWLVDGVKYWAYLHKKYKKSEAIDEDNED